MSKTDLTELQNLTVEEIGEQIGGLTAAELGELRSLETDGGAEPGRKGVLDAIDAAAAALDAAPAAPASKKKGGKADKAAPAAAPTIGTAAKDTAPDWQADDYAGPITIPQANWRRENVKPVRVVSTK